MKFKSLHEKATLIDAKIDQYRNDKKITFLPLPSLQALVLQIFPEATMFGYGLHKFVFRLRHKSHVLMLKIGKKDAIERDHEVYKMLPSSLRHVYFARIFWHTKYCLLQEYGEETEVSAKSLAQLRSIGEKYSLLDITCDNIRSVNGNLKIIDANIAPKGLYGLWKTADIIRDLLPEPIRKAIRKTRILSTVKQR